MSKTKIELGDLVRDRITGFEGVVVCVAEWLTGCKRVNVQPQKIKEDGSVPDSEGFDITQVELVKKRVVQSDNTPSLEPYTCAPPKKKKGGPRPALTQDRR